MRFITLLLWFFAITSSHVFAGESPWQDHQGMIKTRLVTGSADMMRQGEALLAWEAELAPGWKTYWRSPGEAGLPVRLHAGDDEIEILYPTPERFELFGLQTYGYSHKVLLPFYMAAPADDDDLKVRADFMVCKEICVPFEADYELPSESLAGETSPHDIRLELWMKRVPAREGDAGAGLEVVGAKVMGVPGHQRVIVDVVAEGSLSGADLLAEAGPKFHFGAPEMSLMGDGTSARFVLMAMTGKNPEDLRGQKVRLTFLDGDGHAIDRTIALEP
ncbi:protein-disulfide reductase DsbD domain-containing protein [Kordiimonas sp.]|uniref:protein-disulfide reductase DsbD domain-containing protein n=1 Tax=Kordiimonas sp. TaxID=1970157 RepID=UPI003A9106DC